MKKLILLICVALTATLTYAQEDTKLRSNEIKVNALTLVLGNPEISYERLLNENSGLGLSVNFNVANNQLLPYNYMIMPYYRLYVGSKRAAGFFFEGSLAYLSEEVESYVYQGNGGYSYKISDETGFGVGVAIGGKFLIKKSIIFEFFGGLGRNFNANDDGSYAYPRVGVSIGKRF